MICWCKTKTALPLLPLPLSKTAIWASICLPPRCWRISPCRFGRHRNRHRFNLRPFSRYHSLTPLNRHRFSLHLFSPHLLNLRRFSLHRFNRYHSLTPLNRHRFSLRLFNPHLLNLRRFSLHPFSRYHSRTPPNRNRFNLRLFSPHLLNLNHRPKPSLKAVIRERLSVPTFQAA